MPLYFWIGSVHHKCLLLIIIIILTVTIQHSCQERDCQGPSGTGPGEMKRDPGGKGNREGPRGKCPVGHDQGKMKRDPGGKGKGEGTLVVGPNITSLIMTTQPSRDRPVTSNTEHSFAMTPNTEHLYPTLDTHLQSHPTLNTCLQLHPTLYTGLQLQS